MLNWSVQTAQTARSTSKYNQEEIWNSLLSVTPYLTMSKKGHFPRQKTFISFHNKIHTFLITVFPPSAPHRSSPPLYPPNSTSFLSPLENKHKNIIHTQTHKNTKSESIIYKQKISKTMIIIIITSSLLLLMSKQSNETKSLQKYH